MRWAEILAELEVAVGADSRIINWSELFLMTIPRRPESEIRVLEPLPNIVISGLIIFFAVLAPSPEGLSGWCAEKTLSAPVR